MNNRIRNAIKSCTYVEGYVLSESKLKSLLEEILDQRKEQLSGYVICAAGRIYLDGVHVGWVNKQAPFTVLKSFSQYLQAPLPAVLVDMKTITESV
jgi:hypothetical protein